MDNPVINQWLQRSTPACVALALSAGALLICRQIALPIVPGRAQTISPPIWSDIDSHSVIFDGDLFKKQAGEQIAANLSPLARRFRLAGTFFASSSYQQSRKAIIDDIQQKTQCLVSEGDHLDQNVLVANIFRDRIVLRDGDSYEQLWLSFSEAPEQPEFTKRQASDANQAQADTTLVRFGKRTGERRWVLERSAVLNYYQELLNNPDRLAKVFESLKPVYQTGKIAGYTLDVEGEGDFFRAFGLKQGDIIRQVNSMPMISQSRAEYFINEFVKNRVNGFVIDIERETKPEKLIYLVR